MTCSTLQSSSEFRARSTTVHKIRWFGKPVNFKGIGQAEANRVEDQRIHISRDEYGV